MRFEGRVQDRQRGSDRKFELRREGGEPTLVPCFVPVRHRSGWQGVSGAADVDEGDLAEFGNVG